MTSNNINEQNIREILNQVHHGGETADGLTDLPEPPIKVKMPTAPPTPNEDHEEDG